MQFCISIFYIPCSLFIIVFFVMVLPSYDISNDKAFVRRCYKEESIALAYIRRTPLIGINLFR